MNPNFSSLDSCIRDARDAVLSADRGPSVPQTYSDLRGALEGARGSLPPLYEETFYDPFTRTLDDLGSDGFLQILMRDPSVQNIAALMFDIAAAILQNSAGYREIETDGFQEVVSDLFDGFLSAEDRRGVKPPDKGAIPPLVKWGNPHFGPYTFPVTATSSFNVGAPVVNLPPANARHGLMAWAALPHECAHDLLHADSGLHAALADKIRKGLEARKNPLASYWADRVDETASDVLGILNMGPAAGAGLIAYFRGLRLATTGRDSLATDGQWRSAHPIDALRAYLAAHTVSLLSFKGSKKWADALWKLADNSRGSNQITIGGQAISDKVAIESARIVADVLVTEKVEPLENHALGDIQDWRDHDESIVDHLSQRMVTAAPLSEPELQGTYAAHVVAAAVLSTLRGDVEIDLAFSRMVAILKQMHDANPSWGPLFVTHPGDLYRSSYTISVLPWG